MKLDGLRSGGKRLLGASPVMYRLGKRAFVKFKLYNDHKIFKSRYPAASCIDYDVAALKEMRAGGFYSQYGQDNYLWNEIFKRKPTGFYVDIGGNHPIINSNSYFFERRGWRGMAFDPLARAAGQWGKERSAVFHHAAISETAETRDFIEIKESQGWEHALSGFKGFVRDEDMQLYGYLEYPVRAAPLGEFVTPGTHIDLIMIDVEGAEEIVLRGIDLAALKPDYVMIENVSEVGGAEAIRRQTIDQGYDLIARIGAADDLFRRRGL